MCVMDGVTFSTPATFWRVWHHALGNTAVRAMRSEISLMALLTLALTPLASSLEGLA